MASARGDACTRGSSGTPAQRNWEPSGFLREQERAEHPDHNPGASSVAADVWIHSLLHELTSSSCVGRAPAADVFLKAADAFVKLKLSPHQLFLFAPGGRFCLADTNGALLAEQVCSGWSEPEAGFPLLLKHFSLSCRKDAAWTFR